MQYNVLNEKKEVSRRFFSTHCKRKKKIGKLSSQAYWLTNVNILNAVVTIEIDKMNVYKIVAK